MENNILIIGSETDRAHMEELKTTLKAAGHPATVECPTEDTPTWSTGMNAACVILWLSIYTGDEIYSIANQRKNTDKLTYNVFFGTFPLPTNAKPCISGNRSIFTVITDNIAHEFNQILPPYIPIEKSTSAPIIQQPPTSISHSNPTVEQTSSPTNQFISAVQPSTPSVTHNTVEQVESQTNQSTHDISYTKSEVEEPEADNKTVWMPLIWIVCSFIYYFCIEEEIIEVSTDETLWWLVLTVGYFYLGYKIIRSTITAIKISKWCLAYIPFSIAMAFLNIRIGFEFIKALI